MDVSVVIVNYRTADYVVRCVGSLAPAAGALRTELLVVDNSPGALRELAARTPAMRLIENAENVGFARACNQALALARGRAVLLLNPDTELGPGALPALLRPFDGDARVGATAGRLLGSDGTLQPSCRPFPSPWVALLDSVGVSTYYPRPPLLGRWQVGIWAADRVREVSQPMGACLCLRREALEDVGALDERFFVYFEEVDWCLRARRRGWRILYVPEATVIHHEGRSAARDPVRAATAFYRSKLAFCRKHFAGARRGVLIGLLLFEIALRRLAAAVRPADGGRPEALPRRQAYRAAWRAVTAELRGGA